MGKIAFNDLSAQYAALKQDIDAGIADVIAGCHFISGPQVEELERALCAYTGRKFCVAVSDGTNALLMPLMAWGIGPGDAVFVPDFTFFATSEVVSLMGATPVFCDVDKSTFNISVESLKEQIEAVKKEGKLTPKVVIPVDLFGLPADYPAIEALCKEHGLLLLEDAAQGFGGSIAGKKACTFGEVSATSFFPAKPLGCYGDGGAIFTDDPDMYEKLASIRVHGKGGYKYENLRLGLNARLDTLQAAILLPKLRAFDGENERRNRAAQLYTELLGTAYQTPKVPEKYLSSWAQYTLTAESEGARDRLQAVLKDAGVPTMVYYPIPLHMQKVYADMGGKSGDSPVTEALCKTVFSLPMSGYIHDEDIRYICGVLLDHK